MREQLKATDAWGRSLLTHAVLSGRVAVFDAVFYAAREKILDDEVDGAAEKGKIGDAQVLLVDGASENDKKRRFTRVLVSFVSVVVCPHDADLAFIRSLIPKTGYVPCTFFFFRACLESFGLLPPILIQALRDRQPTCGCTLNLVGRPRLTLICAARPLWRWCRTTCDVQRREKHVAHPFTTR